MKSLCDPSAHTSMSLGECGRVVVNQYAYAQCCSGSPPQYSVFRLVMWRGEYLTLYSPVIDDCSEVKQLPFRVT